MLIELTPEQVQLLRDALDAHAYELAPPEARHNGYVHTDWIEDECLREDIEEIDRLDALLADVQEA